MTDKNDVLRAIKTAAGSVPRTAGGTPLTPAARRRIARQRAANALGVNIVYLSQIVHRHDIGDDVRRILRQIA